MLTLNCRSVKHYQMSPRLTKSGRVILETVVCTVWFAQLEAQSGSQGSCLEGSLSSQGLPGNH